MKTKNIFRMLLVAAALLMGANNVNAETRTTIFEDANAQNYNYVWLAFGAFDGAQNNDKLIITYTPNPNASVYKILFNDVVEQIVDASGTAEITLTTSILGTIHEKDAGGSAWIQGGDVAITKIVLVKYGSGSGKTTPTLTFPQSTYNITYGDSFTGPIATCNVSDLEIYYETNNRSVADVNALGEVEIKGAGQATITARTELTSTYDVATASYTINVAKVNYTLSYSSSTATAVLGQSWTAPTLNNPSGISVTYSSTNTGVATIDNNGIVTPVAAGQTTIKANYAGDSNHEAKEASYILTVSTPQPTISFGQTVYTTTFGQAFNAPVPTVYPSGSSVIYTSSNNNVAIVLNNTIIPVGAGNVGVSYGETTITATLADNSNVSATYTLRVNAPTAPEGATSVGAIWLGEYGDSGKGGLQPHLSIEDYFSSVEAGGTIRFYGNVGPLNDNSYWRVEIVNPSWDTPRLYEDQGNGLTNGYFAVDVDDVNLSGIEYIILNGTNITITAIQVISPDTPTKQNVTLAFSPASATATVGQDFTAPTLTATSNGQEVTLTGITYSSSNPDVAEVNASSGVVSIIAEGTTTITAYLTDDETYNNASASYILTVREAEPGPDDWIDLSDDEDLDNYGFRTYVTHQAINFSRSVGVEGYCATGLSGSTVVFTKVTGVCAINVPLLLKKATDSTEETTVECKLLKSTAAGIEPSINKLVAGSVTNNVAEYVYGTGKYVLTVHSDEPVFAEVNINGAHVDADHAYLDLNGTNAARGRLAIRFVNESTGISNIEAETIGDDVIYNLRGQRVENPTKGLYIINGKKVVIK